TAEALQLEKQALLVELRSATGLRGRARQLGPTRPARKAADAVRETLDHVYKVMKKTMPTLVEHLRASIRREGTSYAYRPDFPARSWLFKKTPPKKQNFRFLEAILPAFPAGWPCGSPSSAEGKAMPWCTVSDVARRLGVRPRDISDLFYQRLLDD